MNIKVLDKKIYNIANAFLLNTAKEKGINAKLLNKYFHITKGNSISDVYLKLLESGANRERAQGVIADPIGGIKSLKSILYNFNVKLIIKSYVDPKSLLNLIVNKFHLKINTDDRGMWSQYCKTIISGAKFMSKFKNWNDFDKFVMRFYKDPRARNALPLLLKQEIEGFGLALSCDFLKENGYYWYAKPDIHMIKIFYTLGLSESNNDYDVLNAIVRMGYNINKTPYKVDKLFWLIGSGKLYLDKQLGSSRRSILGRNRNKFILHAKRVLKNGT